jgi:hypothetical protein
MELIVEDLLIRALLVGCRTPTDSVAWATKRARTFWPWATQAEMEQGRTLAAWLKGPGRAQALVRAAELLAEQNPPARTRRRRERRTRASRDPYTNPPTTAQRNLLHNMGHHQPVSTEAKASVLICNLLQRDGKVRRA